MAEQATFSHEPGLLPVPEDTRLWRQWRKFLTKQEIIVYLWLRWKTTRPSFKGHMSIKEMARNLGDPLDGWKWESKGTMPQSQVLDALYGLEDKGLVALSDSPRDAQWET